MPIASSSATLETPPSASQLASTAVSFALRELVSRVCPICETEGDSRHYAEANVRLDQLDDFAFASRKLPEYMHWRLVECKGCDLVYAADAPVDEDLARLYDAAEFDSADEARLASETYAQTLSEIGRRLPDLHFAVDVGTGDGSFLRKLLQAGYTGVIGVEPSCAPIRFADAEIQHLIQRQIFRADSFEPESLSLITCFQTIEHLPDPLRFCRDAFRTLKPGGCLYLVCHNRRALSAKIMGTKSPIFDVEHLQLFSRKSMKNLLENAGFASVSINPIWNRYPLRYWARLFPFPRRLKRRLLDWLGSSPLGGALVSLPAGNLQAVAFKK